MNVWPALLSVLSFGISSVASAAWPRHAVDDSSRGADGARLLDANRDGLPDIATAWEEGGMVRVYLHPGHGGVRHRWPAVTAGKASSGEDAVLIDLDDDGGVDVVSSTEGNTQTVFVHWAPTDPARYLDPAAWVTEPIPATAKASRWMYAAPVQLNGRDGRDLIVGSKAPGAMIAWLEAPSSPRDLAAWKLHPIYRAGWIMSIEIVDMNEDGLPDVLISDRKGNNTGVKWLENPGPGPALFQSWQEHLVGGRGVEAMFLDPADLDSDGLEDIVVAVRPDRLLAFRRLARNGTRWSTHAILAPPANHFGTPKAVAAGDVNDDGRQDLVMSCESAKDDESGVWWIELDCFAADPRPSYRDISGPDGVKFDRLQLIDLDGDGDLDVLTCEENANLGVIWYENPTREGVE